MTVVADGGRAVHPDHRSRRPPGPRSPSGPRRAGHRGRRHHHRRMTATRASSGRRRSWSVRGRGAGARTPGPRCRTRPASDAARNLAKILAAARTTFYEEGVDVSVEVDRAAGRGRHGDALPALPDQGIVDRGRGGRAAPGGTGRGHRRPGGRAGGRPFAEFMRAVGQLQADHAGCLGRLWSESRQSPVRADIENGRPAAAGPGPGRRVRAGRTWSTRTWPCCIGRSAASSRPPPRWRPTPGSVTSTCCWPPWPHRTGRCATRR